MTQAQDFVEWAKDHTKYTSEPDEVFYEYAEDTGIDAEGIASGETGHERRWDREIEDVYRFDDGSLVIVTYWIPLQYDHADGIYPDPSFYVAGPVEVTVTRYERIGS